MAMSLSIDALVEYAKCPRLGLDEKLALAVRLAETAAMLLYLSHTLLGAIPHADVFAAALLRDDELMQEAATNVQSVAHKLICDANAPTVPDLAAVSPPQAQQEPHAPLRWV